MNNDVPMIPKHQAEEALFHMSRAIRSIVIVSVTSALALVVAIIIFVNGYTSRTKDILETFIQMQQRPAVTEAIDGTIQQSSVP